MKYLFGKRKATLSEILLCKSQNSESCCILILVWNNWDNCSTEIINGGNSSITYSRSFIQAYNYHGETLLAQDKCGDAIKCLEESQSRISAVLNIIFKIMCFFTAYLYV